MAPTEFLGHDVCFHNNVLAKLYLLGTGADHTPSISLAKGYPMAECSPNAKDHCSYLSSELKGCIVTGPSENSRLQCTRTCTFSSAQISTRPPKFVLDAGTRCTMLSECVVKESTAKVQISGGALSTNGQLAIIERDASCTDRSGRCRLFRVESGAELHLSRVQLRYGRVGLASVSGATIYTPSSTSTTSSLQGAGGGLVYVQGRGSLLIAEHILFGVETSEAPETEPSAAYGGAIFAVNQARVVIRSANISGNVAKYMGGGIALLYSASLDIESSSRIVHNSAGSGGGLCLGFQAKVNDVGTEGSVYIKANRAASRGGGVHMFYSSTFQGSAFMFANNHASSYGGAMSLACGASALIRTSIFEDNTAVAGGGGGGGGAVSVDATCQKDDDGSDFVAITSTFTRNKAGNNGGGAIILKGEEDSSTLANCSLSNNIADILLGPDVRIQNNIGSKVYILNEPKPLTPLAISGGYPSDKCPPSAKSICLELAGRGGCEASGQLFSTRLECTHQCPFSGLSATSFIAVPFELRASSKCKMVTSMILSGQTTEATINGEGFWQGVNPSNLSTIERDSSCVELDGTCRLFTISDNSKLYLNRLQLRGGQARSEYGGLVHVDSYGHLFAEFVVFGYGKVKDRNMLETAAISGGAIYISRYGRVDLKNCVIAGNSAAYRGAGIFVASEGHLNIMDASTVLFDYNYAGDGSGHNLYGDQQSYISFHSCSPGKYGKRPNIKNDFSVDEPISDCVSLCPPGRYGLEGSSDRLSSDDCTPCPPGRFENREGQASCEYAACTRTEYGKRSGSSSRAEALCQKCPSGYATSNDGAAECRQCAGGSYTDDLITCKACAPGMFRGIDDVPRTHCKNCPNGWHTESTVDLMNASELYASCKRCRAGRFWVSASECRVCPGGYFREDSLSVEPRSLGCQACAAGRFIADDSLDEKFHTKPGDCTSCPRGQLSNDGSKQCTDSSSILPAPTNLKLTVRKISSISERILNTDVRANTTKPLEELTLVSWLQPNMSVHLSKPAFEVQCSSLKDFVPSTIFFTKKVALDDDPENSLIIPIGKLGLDAPWKKMFFFRVRLIGESITTDRQSFALEKAFNENEDRPLASSWSVSLDQTWSTGGTCNSLQYLDTHDSDDPTDWSCGTCPEGASCEAPTPWFGVKPLFGYFRVGGEEDGRSFQSCLYPGACLGAASSEFGSGYFALEDGSLDFSQKDFPESCNEAYGYRSQNTSVNYLCHDCMKGWRRHGVARCLQCPPDAQNYSLMFLGIVFTIVILAVLILSAISDAGDAKMSESVQKVLLNYLQVATMFSGFPLKWPAAIENMFEIQGSISTAGEHLVNPDCATAYESASELFYAKQVWFTFIPIILVMIMFVIWKIPALLKQQDWSQSLRGEMASQKDKFVVSLIVVIYLLYPTICNQAFRQFSCIYVGDELRLLADLQVKCYEDSHLVMSIVFGGFQVIAYVLGIPLLALHFLHRNREHLDSKKTRFRYGILYAGLRKERYYWEIVITIRKVSVIALKIFGMQMRPQLQAHLVSFVIVCCLLAQFYGNPFDMEIHSEYAILHQLEVGALVVLWITLWSGIIMFMNERSSHFHLYVMTFLVVTLNIHFSIRLLIHLFVELLKEKNDNLLVRRISKLLKNSTKAHPNAFKVIRLICCVGSHGNKHRRGNLDAEIELKQVATLAEVIAKSDSSNWLQHKDETTGRTFYMNKITGDKSWNRPNDVQSGDTAVNLLQENPLLEEKSERSHWKSAVDAATGKTYYFNEVTGETSWKNPASSKKAQQRDETTTGKALMKSADATVKALSRHNVKLRKELEEAKREIKSMKHGLKVIVDSF